MLFVDIVGLKNGRHHFEIESEIDKKLKTKEIVNSIEVSGELIVHGDNIYIDIKASTEMNLKCDLSLEDYAELIEADIKITLSKHQDSFEFDSTESDKDNIIYINDEQNKIDISEIVVQELLVKIPMKKVAPQYRDKRIEDIHPSVNKDIDKEEGQSPFDVLKKLNNN